MAALEAVVRGSQGLGGVDRAAQAEGYGETDVQGDQDGAGAASNLDHRPVGA